MESGIFIKEQKEAIKEEDRQIFSLIKSFNPLNLNEEELFEKLCSINNLDELLELSIRENEEYVTFFIKGLLGEEIQREACIYIGKEINREKVFNSSILDVKGNEISPQLLGEIDSMKAKLNYSKGLFLCATFKEPPKIFREILGICYKANYASLASKLVKTMRRYNKNCRSIYDVFKVVNKCGVSLNVFLKMHLLYLNYEIEEEDLAFILKNYYNEAIECYIEGEVHNFLEISKYFEKYVGDNILEKAIYILNSGNIQGIKYIKEKLSLHKEYLGEIKANCNLSDVNVRKAVVDILISYGNKEGDEFLNSIKKGESSKSIKEKIEKYFLEKEELSIRVTESLDKINSYIDKKVKEIKFEDEGFLNSPPVLRWKSGGDCNKNVYKYMVMSYQVNKEVHENIGIVFLTSKIVREDLLSFGEFLFKRWLELGAPTKDKWILSFVGENINDTLVYKLYKLIGELCNQNRYVIANDCVKALLLSENKVALKYVRILECGSKNKRIVSTINEGFLNIAKIRGISIDEVYDSAIITDEMIVGKRYKVGSDEFKTVIIDGMVRLIDRERRVYKQFPVNKNENKIKDLNAAFRSFKYLLKRILDSEKARLYKAFQENRVWKAKEFYSIYIKNAILRDTLTPYVLGVYVGGNMEREFLAKDIRVVDIKEEAFIKIIKIK